MKALFAVLFALFFTLSTEVSAQFRYSYFRLGVAGGTTHYLGDLDDDFTFKFTRPTVGLQGSYRFNPFMTANLSFMQGWASATDAISVNDIRRRRNLSFRTPIREVAATLTMDFLPLDRGYAFRSFMTPYVYGGIAIFSFNPQAQLNGEWIDLQPLGTEGQFLPDNTNNQYPDPYALTQVSIPMGVGVRWAVSKNIDLEIETGFRKTFTDYLDDVSSRYPNLDDLRAQNPLAAILSDRPSADFPTGVAPINGIRGDKTQQDWYIFTVVRVSYILDWVRCPTFR
jgi:opacity protein-like surface antigen